MKKFWYGLLKNSCAAILLFALAAVCLGCNGRESPDLGEDPPPAWASNFDLPDAETALADLNEIYGGAEKVFLLREGKIARMPCPQGEEISLNFPFAVGAYAKLILEDSIAEFNEVFSAINPNYHFTVNYAPSEQDFTKEYSVKVSVSDNLPSTETSQVFGMAHVSYYNNYTELGDFGITIKSEVMNNGAYLMMTFKHELMHLLGAGDAYKNANTTKDTVMQSYTVGGYHSLSKTDVALLDALYRNPAFADEDERISEYVSSYEEKSLHTKAALTAATYRTLVASLDSKAVLGEAQAIGYRDLSEFSAAIKQGIKPDPAFGSKNISFKELEYAEPQSETYFGSIEPENGLYWHGRQTSLGSSQGIGYTDYGGGILFAAPNGNQYMFMIQVGDFVLAFRQSGSFTNLSALSLVLWHISK